jgi:hypothetical protein
MSYSTSNPPFLIAGGLAGGQSSTVGASTASVGFATMSGGGNIWGYRSSDPMATVVGSSYFSNGMQIGMRLNDAVWVIDTGSTAAPTCGFAAVTAISTATGGVSVLKTT